MDNYYGYGIAIEKNVDIFVNRSLLEKNRAAGIIMDGDNINAELKDSIIKNTLNQDDELKLYGRGISIAGEVDIKVERSIISDNLEFGFFIHGSKANAELSDIVIKNTGSTKGLFNFGRGINVQLGASLKLNRAVLENNKEIGLIAIENCNVELNNILISNTQVSECALLPENSPYYCAKTGAGFGLGSIGNSKITFSNLKVEQNYTVGLQLARSGAIFGTDIYVVNNPIGFNIQKIPETYNFDDEVKGLIMENNTVNFDSQELEVPELFIVD